MVYVFVPSFFLSCLSLVLCTKILGILVSFNVSSRTVILVIKSLVSHAEVGHFVNLIALQSCWRGYKVANPGQLGHRIQIVKPQVSWH